MVFDRVLLLNNYLMLKHNPNDYYYVYCIRKLQVNSCSGVKAGMAKYKADRRIAAGFLPAFLIYRPFDFPLQ